MSDVENQNPQPGRNFKKILTLFYVVLNLSSMGVGSYLVYSSTLGYESPFISSEELNRELTAFRKTLQDRPMMYTMDKFTTNLNGLPKRMVRLEINLQMLDAEGFEEIIGLGAKGRDPIVQILNNKSFADVETVQGKLRLKNEIVAKLNSLLENGVVQNIFFSEFVVQ